MLRLLKMQDGIQPGMAGVRYIPPALQRVRTVRSGALSVAVCLVQVDRRVEGMHGE